MLFNNMTAFETHFSLNFFTPRAVALQLQSSFTGGSCVVVIVTSLKWKVLKTFTGI